MGSLRKEVKAQGSFEIKLKVISGKLRFHFTIWV